MHARYKKICLMLVAAIVLGFCLTSCGEGVFGVDDVTAKESDDGYTVSVKMRFGSGNYSISNLSSDEKVTVGERTVSISDFYDLGKYYVELHFGDIEATDTMMKKYSAFEVHELKGSDGGLKFLYTYPSVHDIAIYIGSDEPISVEEETGKMDFKASLKFSVSK